MQDGGIVCCLGCLSLVPGVQKRVIRDAAFFPPRPASYSIDFSRKKIFIVGGIEVPSIEITSFGWIRLTPVKLLTRSGTEIVAIEIRRPDARKTLVFSHGNSTDLGLMLPHLVDMCKLLRVNVVGYEYSGYGESTGQATEKNMYRDIQAVYSYLIRTRKLDPNSVILYGQSVGSAPTLDLASKPEVSVGAVVLHSPIKSALAVLKNEISTTYWFDAFKNIEKIQQVKCPLFVIHGEADAEVSVLHGKALHEAAPNATHSWFVKDAGHNNIELLWRGTYFAKLREFISSLDATSRCSSPRGDPSDSDDSCVAAKPHGQMVRPKADFTKVHSKRRSA